MTPTALRFYCEPGGTLIADRRPVSLEWAMEKIHEWWTLSLSAPTQKVADEYIRQADALMLAVAEHRRWLRASGPNPMIQAYVKSMLRASVEQGGDAA